ncbi:MAG: alpha/beta hydrolase [Azospirillaceae bacterium]|nr:alpha/beta hydrolase [Azospirillaceae bacterium]
MFQGFTRRRIATSGAEINLRVGGEGPPLLLLHGFPQSHVCWHRVAPELARSFTVVATDLRGYGDSAKPPDDADHVAYSKRAMARDQVEVMSALGFNAFFLAGHDRGGRVAQRLVLDHGERVLRLAMLDIVPTLSVVEAMDLSVATDFYHWLFLSQPGGLPEHFIGFDPDFFLRRQLATWGATEGAFVPDAFAEYQRCFRNPAAIAAMCADYRAALTIDLSHDRAGREAGERIGCPLLALWARHGVMARHFDVLQCWREVADAVYGEAIDCGHFLAEEQPEATVAALTDFFNAAC